MNIENHTHDPADEIFFGVNRGVLQVNPAASLQDITEEVCTKLSMLKAMLTITHGCGAKSFDQWSDSVRDNYLWSCATMAEEIEALSERANTLVHQNTPTS